MYLDDIVSVLEQPLYDLDITYSLAHVGHCLFIELIVDLISLVRQIQLKQILWFK